MTSGDQVLFVPVEDPHDRRAATTATGLLRELNLAGVLAPADIHVAQRLGRLGDEDDERVHLAVALAVRAARSGSVCVGLADAANLAPDLAWPDLPAWQAAVDASPLLGTALRSEAGQLYLDRFWHEESQVVDDLRARAAASPPELDQTLLAAALDTYFPDLAFADQRAAAEKACRGWTTVVTGGPGTGKTTTIARLLGVLMTLSPGQPLRVALAAPTGKAAARMAQAVREATEQEGFPLEHVDTIRAVEARTLHRLLGSRPDNRTRFRHHRATRLPHDLVIVDETSMVSLTMTARLLEAVRPEARLVLVGDADQLASVDAGAVLKDLVDGYGGAAGSPVDSPGVSPVTELGPTRRYGEQIGALAEAVKAGDPDRVVSALRGGAAEVVWLTDPTDPALPELLASHAVALHAAAASGNHAEALRRLDRHRLLCAHREGPYGVAQWNRVVERLLMEGSGQEWLDGWYAGQPLIVNSNDYGLGLWNGDTGVVCRDPDDPSRLVAVLDDGGTLESGGGAGVGRRLPTTRFSDVSTAHAMTVHRSQGSQFAEVTVLLPEASSRILTRELLYTAVTRARSVVRVVGSEDAVRAAVLNPARRATGLAHRLR